VGTINNSKLELVASLTHQDILVQHRQVANTSNALLNNNTAAIHWLRWGSTMTTGAPTYLLQQQHHQYLMSYDYAPGLQNQMANDCSWLWHLTNAALLSYFDLHLCTGGWLDTLPPPSTTNSVLISVLQCKWPMPALYLPGHLPLTATGASGPLSALPSAWTPTLLMPLLTQSSSSTYLPFNTKLAGWHHKDAQSKLRQWRMPYAWWVRCWPYWGPWSLGSIA